MIKLILLFLKNLEFRFILKTAENKKYDELKIHKDLENLSESVDNSNSLFWEMSSFYNVWNLQRIHFLK